MVLGVFVDQLKNAYLQVQSRSLGPEMTFNIWWTQFYFENIGKILIHVNYMAWFVESEFKEYLTKTYQMFARKI